MPGSKDLLYDQWFGLVERNAVGGRSRKVLLFHLGEARSTNGGKPPPESFSKIRACDAMSFLTKTSASQKSLLCTDGAPCYPRLAKECGALHHYVNHSAGEFARPEWYLRKRVSVHTGIIDSVWAQLKRCIPNNLRSTSKDIPLYIRMRQWRHWHSSQHASLLTLTSKALSKKRNE